MFDLSNKFLNDEELAMKYAVMRPKGGPSGYDLTITDGCDSICRHFVHCETSTSDYAEW